MKPQFSRRDRSGRDRPLARYFYLAMALLVTAVVALGFGRTAPEQLLHSPTRLPLILHVHAAVFTSWVLLFIVQAALVHVRRIQWHRRLGRFGAMLGASMPLLGVATALVMQRWNRAQGPVNDAFLALSFNDMASFAVLFGLAMYWRRQPEFHRRAMLMATCALTGAAFARFPPGWLPPRSFYAGIDVLIALGLLRDWLVDGRVHAVYRYGLPALIAGQTLAMYLWLASPPWWLAIAHRVSS